MNSFVSYNGKIKFKLRSPYLLERLFRGYTLVEGAMKQGSNVQIKNFQMLYINKIIVPETKIVK